MNLDGRTFRAIANSSNGTLDTDTELHFTAMDPFVVGRYSGGPIVVGQLLGKWLGDSELEMLYHGATESGVVQEGQARSTFESQSGEPTRMHLDWQWLTGDRSGGQSDWNEV